MKNILKVIGLSLSAALSCSADKCWNCNVNDATGVSSGLCEQCESQQCTHCGRFDPAAERTASNGIVCTECAKMRICRNCGKFEEACVTSTGTCMECFQHECSQCGIVDSSVKYDAASYGNFCEQCRKAKQDPFGM